MQHTIQFALGPTHRQIPPVCGPELTLICFNFIVHSAKPPTWPKPEAEAKAEAHLCIGYVQPDGEENLYK